MILVKWCVQMKNYYILNRFLHICLNIWLTFGAFALALAFTFTLALAFTFTRALAGMDFYHD